MTSILKVDTIQDTAGNNIINESSDTITIGASGDTINIVGTLQNNGSGLASGITEADQWRLTTNVTANTATIVNWERNDSTAFGKIGTGMSESSGIFTFPSTGVWYVNGVFQIEVASGDYAEVVLEGTVDNLTYVTLSYGGEYSDTGGASGGSPVGCFVNVTSTSLRKIKFSANDFSAGTLIRGNTSSNRTWVDFIRLGDSV